MLQLPESVKHMSQSQVTITRRGAERAREGHLWIYRSDVRDTGRARGGEVVRVRDERGRHAGQAFYSDRSEIALRLLSTQNADIDREWWRTRLRASAARRKGLEREADAFRLVYSEGDLLPSLIMDRYSDVLVLQTLSQGTEALKETLVELLVEEFAPRSVVERNDVRVRALEGLPVQAGVLY
ncbi:MAG: rRNA (cytosine1962-C5)-methyltransferase, partial [Acidobacteriota bacterium]|nr:rRNA (cytosine1962-C5)-methyltransferase [Acidobacteriota bacterium]